MAIKNKAELRKEVLQELEREKQLKRVKQMNEKKKEITKKEGIQQGKKHAFRISAILGSFILITGFGAYVGTLAYQTQNIDLKQEIKNTDLDTILITKEYEKQGASDIQILNAVINKNLETIKDIHKYKLSEIKYDEKSLTGNAKVNSTNWLSKQDVQISYKVQVK